MLSSGCSKYDLELDSVSIDQLFQNLSTNNSSRFKLVNIWSTSCDPCKKEFPYIVNLEKKYEPDDLQIIFLSVDWDEQSSEAYKFLKEQNVSGIHYRKNEGDEQNFINRIDSSWSGVIPFTCIFNRKNSLVISWEGIRSKEFFHLKLDSLIATYAR
tara:strand:- start:302 stop:769 length:468 start_codon:yes stop_codon:yes gene_type:complete